MAGMNPTVNDKGKKGPLGQNPDNVPSNVGPFQIDPKNPTAKFQEADFGAVASTPKGSSLSQRGSRGGGPTMAGSEPLTSFTQVNPTAVGAEAGGASILSGNHNPKRGPGKSTTEGDRKKLAEAGS